MIFTTSQPRSTRSATAAARLFEPSHSPPRYQQWPPGGVIGGPAAAIVARSGSARKPRVTKPRSPRSRTVVTPPSKASRAFARARAVSAVSSTSLTCCSSVPRPLKTRCWWQSTRPGNKVTSPKSCTSIESGSASLTATTFPPSTSISGRSTKSKPSNNRAARSPQRPVVDAMATISSKLQLQQWPTGKQAQVSALRRLGAQAAARVAL